MRHCHAFSRLLSFFSLFCFIGLVQAGQASVNVLVPLSTSLDIPQPRSADPSILRRGKVYFDTTLLDTLTIETPDNRQAHNVTQAQTLTLIPFQDRTFEAVLTRKTKHKAGLTIYSGKLVGQPQENVVIVTTPKTFTVSIIDNIRRYELVGSTLTKTGTAKEIDRAKITFQCGAREIAKRPNFGVKKTATARTDDSFAKLPAARPDLRGLQPADKAFIDIMFIYDNGAQQWVEDNNNTAISLSEKQSVFAATTVTELNQIMDNNDLNIEFRFVHNLNLSVDAPTSSDSFSNRLDEISEGTTAPFSSIKVARNTHQADIVAYLTSFSGGGIAWIGQPEGRPNSGVFSVNQIYTGVASLLAHELGHNFGAQHAKDQPTNPPGDSEFGSYAYGSYFGGQYHSIMAYSKNGFRSASGMYSSPDTKYQGIVTGNAAEKDNRRVLIQMSHKLASYRQNDADAIALPEALDNNELSFSTDGAKNWFGQRGTFSETGNNDDAAQSPHLDLGQSSSIKTTINSGGILTFSSKSNGFGDYQLYVNGVKTQSLNDGDFTSHRVFLRGSVNEVEWRYTRSSEAKDYDKYYWNAGWLDSVSFTEIQPISLAEAVDNNTLVFTTGSTTNSEMTKWFGQAFTSNDGIDAAQAGEITDGQQTWLETKIQGPGQLAFDWRVSSEKYQDKLSFSINGKNARQVTNNGSLSGTNNSQFVREKVIFAPGEHVVRWTYSKDLSGRNGSDSAWVDGIQFQPYKISINEALDNSALAFTTGGDGEWFGQPVVSNDGVDALRAGNIADSQTTWVETTITGPIKLSFDWLTSSESSDILSVLLDDTAVSDTSYLSGNDLNTFRTFSFEIPSGSHKVKWQYKKDSSIEQYEDTAWLDNVQTSPAKTYKVNVTQVTGGNVTCSSLEDIVSQNVTCSVNVKAGYTFIGWTGVCESKTKQGCEFTLTENVDISVRLAKTISLNEALDNDTLTFKTGGSLKWFGTADSKGDFAQSGKIKDGETTWITTTVQGPIQLTFDWRASSEEFFDVLEVYLDGEAVDKGNISGQSSEFTTFSVNIPSGTHEIKWQYKKDSSSSEFADTVWLDNVRLIQSKTGAIFSDSFE